MIGIIGALNEEIDGLIALLENKKEITAGGTKFVCGDLYGKNIVAALSGVGKVNASMTASFMLALFPKIKAIINIGVAGGLAIGMKQGDLIVSTKLIQHDFTLNSLEVPIGKIPGFQSEYFYANDYLVKLSEKILEDKRLRYQKGIVVTGDEFISSDTKVNYLREKFNAVACDMESAAIAHVCQKTNIKFLSMRAASDNGDNSASLSFDEWLPIAASINVTFVCSLLKEIDIKLL